MSCPVVAETLGSRRFAWLPATNDPINHFAQFAYQRCWEPFVQFVGDKMTPALRRTGEALATNVIRMLDGFVERPNTLVHGDYRADNLFFGGAVAKLTGTRRGGLAGHQSRRGRFRSCLFSVGQCQHRRAERSRWICSKHYTDILRENGVPEYGLRAVSRGLSFWRRSSACSIR